MIEAKEEHDGAYLLQMGCLFFLHDTASPIDDELDDENGNLLSSVVPGDMIQMGGLLYGYQSPYRIVAATPVRLLRLSLEGTFFIASPMDCPSGSALLSPPCAFASYAP